MSKGYAIVFGLNNVDPVHYDGWDGALGQPENDASVIYQIASGNWNRKYSRGTMLPETM